MPKLPHLDEGMQACVEACRDCHEMCLAMASNHCLEQGGAHVEPEHFRLMLNCAQMCQTAADFMLTASPFHGATCEVCAEVCEACAVSCEELDGMEACVQACRRCAEECWTMAGADDAEE